MYKACGTDDPAPGGLTLVPRSALTYIAHTEGGASIRALARRLGRRRRAASRTGRCGARRTREL